MEIARHRVADEGAVPTERPVPSGGRSSRKRGSRSAAVVFEARAVGEGNGAQTLAEDLLAECGFTVTGHNARVRGLGVTVDLVATDAAGKPWYFDVSGAYTSTRGGLSRTDTVLRALGRAHVLAAKGRRPFVLLTSHLPRRPGDGDTAIRAAGSTGVFDVIQLLGDPDGFDRLRRYGAGGRDERPLAGFWSDEETA